MKAQASLLLQLMKAPGSASLLLMKRLRRGSSLSRISINEEARASN